MRVNYTRNRSDSHSFPCPYCGYPGPHQTGPGTRVHFARLLCGRCSRYLRWLKKPRPAPAQEVQP